MGRLWLSSFFYDTVKIIAPLYSFGWSSNSVQITAISQFWVGRVGVMYLTTKTMKQSCLLQLFIYLVGFFIIYTGNLTGWTENTDLHGKTIRWTSPIRFTSIDITSQNDAALTSVLACWLRHQMETFSALLLALCARNSPVTGESPSQRPVTRSFDIFFELCLE